MLGFERMGPKYPAGRRAHPWPPHLPPDSLNVPTYHTTRQSPATAQTQMDHVFASRGFHTSVTVRALNSVEEWGASDHCRLLIEVGRPEVTDPSAKSCPAMTSEMWSPHPFKMWSPLENPS